MAFLSKERFNVIDPNEDTERDDAEAVGWF